ncbi:relaxase/mobilization nuclease domain-containing protein [Sulfurirhabdus autotrophica]|uniref:Relaxase/mobilization nuclease-like protein n=1 Tax=Sulfurirhabdus autotrophica TaxID=1706046 RepID=A0A4R3XUY3_9PROT|nr:relaxase/mobilization nuclease domain-containing protein [Sulfurirhabdus autotrophica]TCV82717.1 relaxase/mobilization nuclease-like protein [Sulfurirhabdus autotrophica]
MSKLNILSVPGLGIALDGPVRPKKRKTPNIKDYSKAGGSKKTSHTAKLIRVLNKAPEVMVKVSGSGKGQGHVLAHMTYITRNGKIEAENERGETIAGLDEVQELFEQWGFDANNSERNRAKSVHIVLSMPNGTDPNAVLWAARKFAQEAFSQNHQYLMALHTDTDHPHVHLAVKTQGFDMTYLKRSKADLQEWREMFAGKLREQGIQAEATPRRARGVAVKGKSQSMHHLTFDKDKHGNPRSKGSTVLKEKVEGLIREIDGQTVSKDRPWEKAMADKQMEVREAYINIEKNLRASADNESHKVADKLALFLKQMPPIETERMKLQRQLAQVMSVQQEVASVGKQDPTKSR